MNLLATSILLFALSIAMRAFFAVSRGALINMRKPRLEELEAHAGPEVAVASTKAFVAQAAALQLLALHLARVRGALDDGTHRELLAELQALPAKLTPTIDGNWRWVGTKTLFFDPVGRAPMATDYTVEIPAGVKDALGRPRCCASSPRATCRSRRASPSRSRRRWSP